MRRPSRCLCAVLVLLLPGTATAETEEDQQRKELGRVRQRIESTRQSREELEARRNELVEQLGNIERGYGRAMKTMAELQEKGRRQSRRMAELEREKNRLAQAVRTQHKALAGQARSAYAAGRESWLKLVLQQEDPSRLSRVMAYYNYLNRARLALLQDIDRDVQSAQKVQDELRAEAERLGDTQSQTAAEQAQLERSRSERKQLLARLDSDLRDKDAELRRLSQDEQRLQDLIASLRLSSSVAGSNQAVSPTAVPLPATPSGTSKCPVEGRVAEAFGAPRMSGRWDGMLIAATEGTPVRAVAAGKIAFADWLRGYGLLTIIDHGDGYMSLYAFNQSLYKNVGDQVDAGEVIATVGTSGGRQDSALYFGIRDQGRPVNPMPWCRLADGSG